MDARIDTAVASLTAIPNRWPCGLLTRDELPLAPGLYAWWANADGCSALSNGLDIKIEPGLIYAGQAGATRWPSGKTVRTTLRSRVWGNHINGNIRGSTFRRTIAAILKDALQFQLAGHQKVDVALENRLTDWIRNHLSVSIYPYEGRDELMELEEVTLNRLDPPLNLLGMNPTPLRLRLRNLRKLGALPYKQTPSRNADGNLLSADLSATDSAAQPTQPTLHDEILEILHAHGNRWMTTKAIAELVNKRDRYKKRDGSDMKQNQIHARTKNYDHLFKRDGQKVKTR
jgi:hypothetical protein